MRPRNEPTILTPQLIASEEKALISRWSQTKLLQGLDEKHHRIAAISLECQRLWNETASDTDGMASFKRVSIPIIRRLVGAMQALNVKGFDTRIQSVDPKFQIVPPFIGVPWQRDVLTQFKQLRSWGQYNLDEEADRTAKFALELANLVQENAEKAAAEGKTYYFYCIGLVDSAEVGGFKVPHRKSTVIFYEFE